MKSKEKKESSNNEPVVKMEADKTRICARRVRCVRLQPRGETKKGAAATRWIQGEMLQTVRGIQGERWRQTPQMMTVLAHGRLPSGTQPGKNFQGLGQV